MLDLGQEAAVKGYRDAMLNGQSAYDATAGGLNFRVYLEKKYRSSHKLSSQIGLNE